MTNHRHNSPGKGGPPLGKGNDPDSSNDADAVKPVLTATQRVVGERTYATTRSISFASWSG